MRSLKSLMIAVCLVACAPAPEVLRQEVAQLRTLAERTNQAHAAKCTPPAAPVPAAAPFPPSTGGGEPPPSPPAVCRELETCVSEIQAAAKSCKSAIDAAAQSQPDATYSAKARICREQQGSAGRACTKAGVAP